MSVTPCTTHVSPAFVPSQLPPVSAARSTITEPGRIPLIASSVIRTGAFRPGMAAVVITRSMSATCFVIADWVSIACSAVCARA